MKASTVFFTLATFGASLVDANPQLQRRQSAHTFTLVNHCGNAVQPHIADTRCGYSPRCADASSFTGGQPGLLAPGATETVQIPGAWVGRVFVNNGACGASGENCSLGEFNLDTGSAFTAQSYDISNVQGFTQAMQITAQGCDTVTCTSADCGCANAYPIGDTTGCGDDAPVRACGPGAIAFTITYCP